MLKYVKKSFFIIFIPLFFLMLNKNTTFEAVV